MQRVYVYKSTKEKNGKVMALENSLEAFKTAVSKQFDIDAEKLKIFTENGCEVDDLLLIRDEDKLFIKDICVKDVEICNNIENNLKSISVENTKEVSDWITLNVGGKHFTTTRSTLIAKEPLSMLARMFADDNNVYLMNPSTVDSTGAYLIDRSPEYFEPILNYLRHGVVILDKHVNPKGVLEEAVFYGMLNIFYLILI